MAQVPIHPGLFTLPGDPRGPRLLAARCPSCSGLHFPAGETCPYCGTDGCAEVAIGAEGRLSLWTAVRNAPPGYRGPVPYGFGVVDLPEGLRVVTRLASAEVERMHEGLAMDLVIEPLFANETGDEVLAFAYAPRGDR
ncbi:MAG: Zn-ribbon domain-containing OB-fold protein [Alphaproteobacteria bacterium]